MPTTTKTKERVTVLKTEYQRLKKLDRYFSDFFVYLEHAADIREARKEVKQRKVIEQEKLFSRLGL